MPVELGFARRATAAAVLLMLPLAVSEYAEAQDVTFRSRNAGLPLADEAVIRVLERGGYTVFTRDTVLSEGDIVPGDLIVIRSTLRVEGRIAGDLIGVQADIFARPGGRVDGAVVVLAGGFYGSSLASLSTEPIDASTFDYQAQSRDDGSYVILGPRAAARVRLSGLYGLLMPQYDRVNAVTLEAGLDFERGATTWLPDASLRARYRSVRTDFDADLALRWPFGRHMLKLQGGRTVRSNDRWINSDLENSVYALVGGIDTRNYYEADFAEAAMRVEFGTGMRWWTELLVGWERPRSLANRDPFSIFTVRGGFQDNLPVVEQDAASASLDLGFKTWISGSVPLEIGFDVERADADVAGELTYTLFGGRFAADIPTFGRQTLFLDGWGQAPGSSGAPSQRWRALGGWGSLPTLRPTEQAGDWMWWWAATYRFPLRPKASLLTRVVVWLQYAAGNAWVEGGARPAAAHNIGLGAIFGPLAAGVYTDPNQDFKTVFALGIDTRR